MFDFLLRLRTLFYFCHVFYVFNVFNFYLNVFFTFMAAGARAQQQMRAASCWEPRDEAKYVLVMIRVSVGCYR